MKVSPRLPVFGRAFFIFSGWFMKENYQKALGWVLQAEGGYSNHPKDPGGATNFGITQRTYDAWQQHHGLPTRSVKLIEKHDVDQIYREQYANPIRFDELPSGLDYAMFDFAVNSGVSRAVKTLQAFLGVEADGIIGVKTLEALKKQNSCLLATQLCDERLAFMKRLKTWDTFGKGWTSRVTNVQIIALSMCKGVTPKAEQKPADGGAYGEEKWSAAINDAIRNPTAAGAIAAQAGGILSVFSGNSPIHWAIAALLLIGGLTLIVKLVRQ
ncbi:glycoside hydrolase family 108 protein [Suttonella ornithocola]|uniref:glycoside hydrolase family 108 protein n=1 Tax=Suttonella ornithocola TaxID=279832 RepID=UPI001471E701|nr:glycoside hydrolase family 108 protein [Suttonella ornithocola]